MRVATIDIGTNTTLMLVSERGADGGIAKVADFAEITRLGKGVDRTKRLDDEAIARTIAVLERYASKARELGATRIAAVATSASRDASNGAEFRARAAKALGVAVDEVQIVDGARESKLTFVGALGGLGLAPNDRVAVIDVGGGSTEIVVGRAKGASIEWAHSFDVGSVRLTERHVKSDPPTPSEIDAVTRAAKGAFDAKPPPPGPFAAVVAIAGTATSYAAIDRKLVRYEDDPPHGHRLSTSRLAQIVLQLATVPLETRKRTVGLEPARADVIVAGGTVLTTAALALHATEIVVSDHGVRWGLAEELLSTERESEARR